MKRRMKPSDRCPTSGAKSKSPSKMLGDLLWSHDRGLNPRPHPYHGCALPTELSRHGADYIVCTLIAKFFASQGFFVQCRVYETLCL